MLHFDADDGSGAPGPAPAGDDSAGDDAPNPSPGAPADAPAAGADTDQDTKDSDAAPSPDEDSDADAGADDAGDAELDDETLDTLADAYRDRLLKSKSISKTIADQVRQEVARQVSQQVRSVETESRVESLINRGRTAATAVAELADVAQKELTKAAKGEAFDATVFSSEALTKHLGDYGTAVSAFVSEQFDNAVEAAWAAAFDDGGLPELSDEQAGELADIVQTFRRMEGDKKQAADAKSYFFTNLFQFLARRGAEQGALAERARIGKTKTVGEKIASKNAVAAAKAKLAGERAPPQVPKSKGGPSGDLDDQYDKAKAAGDKDRAQAIVRQMMGQGRMG